MKKFTTIQEYLAAQPPAMRKILSEMRGIILKAAPGVEEIISYGMPAIRKHGIVVWYAGARGHYALYPRGVVSKFGDRLKDYDTSKGTIRFAPDKPIPKNLITDIVRFRLKENEEQAMVKAGRKRSKHKRGK